MSIEADEFDFSDLPVSPKFAIAFGGSENEQSVNPYDQIGDLPPQYEIGLNPTGKHNFRGIGIEESPEVVETYLSWDGVQYSLLLDVWLYSVDDPDSHINILDKNRRALDEALVRAGLALAVSDSRDYYGKPTKQGEVKSDERRVAIYIEEGFRDQSWEAYDAVLDLVGWDNFVWNSEVEQPAHVSTAQIFDALETFLLDNSDFALPKRARELRAQFEHPDRPSDFMFTDLPLSGR